MRVAVAVPCHTSVTPQTARSLCEMFGAIGKTPQIEVGINFFGNAVSTFGRNALVRWAKENRADFMLWVDTDMVFPADAAHTLLSSSRPFIGVNYSLKEPGGVSCCSGLGGDRLVAKPAGIEQVEVIGFGLTLTSMEVLDSVGDPWFMVVNEAKDGPRDEVRFCEIATAAEFPPYVDHELSAGCGHVGFTEYRLNPAPNVLEPTPANP